MRRKFIWSPKDNALVEVSTDHLQPQRAPYVVPDLPDYVSPVTGLVVSGRRQRRNDLARTGSRPWEGLAAEREESERQRAYFEQKQEQRLDHAVRSAYHQLSPEKRRILEGR